MQSFLCFCCLETVRKYTGNGNKAGNRSSARTLTTVELLKAEVQRQQEEINRLNEKLDRKDQQMQVKDELIADYGLRFAKLADQAQQLNLTDKDQNKLEMLKGKNNLSSNNTQKSIIIYTKVLYMIPKYDIIVV